MHMYKVAGCTGTLQASTRQLLKCLCPHLALYPAHAFSLSSRRAVSSTTDSSHSTVPDLPTSLSQGPVLDLETLDGDDDDHGSAASPGPGSLRDAVTEQGPLPPGLYVIPTPIGNLQDITMRAANTLRRVNLLLAEDTRHTRKLLNFLAIRHLEVLSCHEHNEKQRLAHVLRRLQQGEPVGLVSDAGMPGISDPGHVVVAAAVAAGVRVVALPGPCAFVTALVGSGLSTDNFTFAGFLPPKSGARRQALERLASLPGTLVLFAPPHGLAGVLGDCVATLGGFRRCCVARELSKVHEEYFRSTLDDAFREFNEVRQARGEICLLVEGADGPRLGAAAAADAGAEAGAEGGGAMTAAAAGSRAVERVLRELLEEGMSVSGAVKEVVTNLGANKKAAYAAALRLSDQLAAAQKAGVSTN